MNKKYLLKGLLTTLVIFGISGILYLYTAGYRVEKEAEKPLDLSITGMINAKSIPEGSTVYLNDQMIAATDSTIGGINPGKHNLRIVKSGFMPWEKDIEVFPELVTDITAVLVSKTPRIEPLTQTGATNPAISPSLNSIAYFSQDDKEPGVWILPLTSTRLNIFSSTPSVVLEDTSYTKFSEGLNIIWSPDEKQLLIQQSENNYYLADLTTKTAKSTKDWAETLEAWEEILLEKRKALIEKLEIEENIKEAAISPNTVWSPDGKKFLYQQVNTEGKIEYRVYNMENPLPVGEVIDTLVISTNKEEAQPQFTWFADSFHLIMLNKEEDKGIISLIRIDGTNKTEIYNNKIYSNNVFSAPSWDKIIVLTSFRTEGQSDLYTISIR